MREKKSVVDLLAFRCLSDGTSEGVEVLLLANMFIPHHRHRLVSSLATTCLKRKFSGSLTDKKSTLVLGCVSYCDAVSSIWEGMRKYFHKKKVPFDFVLFTSYERQLESLLNGHIDIAWNGPLAHARLQRLIPGTISLGMRDVDRDFVSYLVTTKASNIKHWTDLRNKRLATGTYDSPQAYVVPMHHLLSTLSPSLVSTIDVTRYDFDMGKHGDTAVGELHVIDALRSGTNKTFNEHTFRRMIPPP